jgi:hypothetical protein
MTESAKLARWSRWACFVLFAGVSVAGAALDQRAWRADPEHDFPARQAIDEHVQALLSRSPGFREVVKPGAGHIPSGKTWEANYLMTAADNAQDVLRKMAAGWTGRGE